MYTKSEIAKRRSVLSTDQLALLQKRIQRKIELVAPTPTIPQRLPGTTIPLSFAQQRLWFLQQFDPENAAYNEMISLRLQNTLNYTALNQTIATIVQRHEVMRTIFPLTDEGATQVIRPMEEIDVVVPVIDLQSFPQKQHTARQWVEEEMQRPFHLTEQLPWRIHLLQLDPHVHILVITMHHIITDAWSLEIFVKELVTLYQAYCHNSPSSLPELPIQYADYACWQHQWLKNQTLDKQIHYWQEQLSSPLPVLALPFDHPRPAILTHHGRRHIWSMPNQLYQAVNQLSQREGTTLFMVLLAAFNVLLYRYTLQEDILVGSPVAGRLKFELEPLLGCFVNTLVFRTDLSGKPSFRELLQRVRQMALAAFENQDVPFEKLVEVLQPERSTGRNPIFQAMFVLQNVPMAQSQPLELAVTPFEITVKTTRFDLSMVLQETSQAISGYIEYNTDLFNTDTIERLLGHYQHLLEGITAHPDTSIADLPLLSPAEWQRIFSTPTWDASPTTDSVCQLFEAQVKRTPDAIAVYDELEQLTYQELNTRAYQLAAHLQQHGILPEQIIGLYCQRNVLWAISILAIFKANAAYLPLDPQHPPTRLHSMLEQSQCSLLLCSQELAPRLLNALAETPIPILYLESLLATPPTDVLKHHDNFSDAQLAYVIFTSGSTGQPKGVMVEQRGMRNHLLAKISALDLHEQDIVAQTASQCFDISIWQLLAPWLVGAQVRIYPEQLIANSKTMLQQLQRDSISIIEGVPSWLRALLDVQTEDRAQTELEQLRWVIPTGEALPIALCKHWLERYPAIPLLNAYGPTECSDDVTHQEICSLTALDSWGSVTPIGKSLPNLYIYVLDSQQQPQPIGIWGEIYVGGIGVGRGYIGNAQRTAEKFVPNPWGKQPGERLYRTGDIGRYRSDGTIEFQGRLDQQIKLRGYRIELGDIEAVLSLHPSISNCVVLLREDIAEYRRIVAYITLTPEQYASPEELWYFLRQQLPDYMLPATFMYLETLPLLTNGKIDRQALPAPDTTRPLLEAEFVAARDPMTETLVAIWSNLLHMDIEQISIHDNFFSLGGHSLLIPQLATSIQSSIGVELPWPTFFSSPTIAEQAKAMQQALQHATIEETPQLVAVSRTRELPLSFTQERQWFLDQLNPEQHLYNIFGGIRLSGPFQISALEYSLQEIINRHEILRTTFVLKSDGTLKQDIASRLILPLSFVDMHDFPELEQELRVSRLVNQEKHWTFDLARGPLLRATIVYLEEDEYILLLTCHAIILDGWATEVLLHEMAQLYTAFVENTPSPLPALPLQYADYACWQRALLTNETLEHLQEYWSKQLTSLPTLTLPTDRPRPTQPTFGAATLPIYVPKELTEKLKTLSKREGTTLYMTLLAAYQTILSRYSGQDDIVVGSPIANRNALELEGLIGNFTNTLVMRTNTSGNPTFQELLRRVRFVALNAYAHQDLPFEKLLAELHPERDMSRNPIFQALFAFQNIPQLHATLPGLTTDYLADGGETTVFDLDLTLWEDGHELSGSLKYSTDIFDAPLVELIKADFMALLELVVTDPEQHITDMILSPRDEQRKLLNIWNATDSVYRQDICLHQLFEEQVLLRPQAVAVVFADKELTYAQLNQQANRIAHHLHALGIGPGDMVAIFMERSLEIIPALLAVLKAGASYVPLEVSFPTTRIQWILNSLHIRMLLTQSTQLPTLQKLDTLPELEHILCLDASSVLLLTENTFQQYIWTQADVQHYPSNNLSLQLSSNALAYIIFTSGSTGNPKGVMIRHQPVINLIEWVNRTFQVNSSDRVLFITSLCFDLSVYDIFGLLAAGGSIQVVSSADLREPERLLDLLESTPVTFWDSAPAALQQLVPFFSLKQPSNQQSQLRLVFLSGDWIPVKLPDQVRGYFSDAEVVSLGGATEATVWSNFFRIGEVASQWASIPYGKPIQNAQYYILDHYLNPCPIGVAGDLYISGLCLAEGYIGEPELTAQKFLPSPFGNQSGTRLYKTGDVARFWSDGTMEFLGRSDTQVKIRGFRIELGEIEATLTRHPGLQVAIVEARRDQSGEKRLLAYVVPLRGNTPTQSELRSYLLGLLPEYMLPTTFVFLDSLPVTSNGKVDRRLLPEVEEQSIGIQETTYVAPTTPLEAEMAQLWTNLLQLPRIGIHENFFEIGGHSLLAIQLVAQIRSRWQIPMPLRDFFAFSTIAGLTEQVAQRLTMQKSPEMSLGHN